MLKNSSFFEDLLIYSEKLLKMKHDPSKIDPKLEKNSLELINLFTRFEDFLREFIANPTPENKTKIIKILKFRASFLVDLPFSQSDVLNENLLLPIIDLLFDHP